MFRSPTARVSFLLLVVGLLAACAAPGGPTTATPEPSVSLTDCRLAAPEAAVNIAARCATIPVPEDHADASGATIDLNVVVVPALGNTTSNDPLLLIAGGPGQAATTAFAPILGALRELRQSRDLVLVDQRGTGGSAPLQCPATELEPTADTAAVSAWVRACLEAQAGDLSQYTTEAAVQDLDLVRAALGYEQLNLLGVSYGTRVAQHYARRFPERTRTLVLDGIARPELAIGAEFARDGQRALELLSARCSADPACNVAFPSIQTDLRALLADLAAAPVEVSLADPHTGAPTTVVLTRDLVATTVLNLSYTPETSALIPLVVSAAATGDLQPLAAQTLLITGRAANEIALGMRFSVLCAEDAPFVPAELPGVADSYLGAAIAEQLIAPCAIWPAAAAPADLRTPLQSDIPALLLSGEADPVTPPANGDAVAAGLPNSLHIVAPEQGHNVFYRGCLPRLVAAFIDTGSVTGLDVACVEQLSSPPFFTTFSGPSVTEAP